jgi:hypothetical protein
LIGVCPKCDERCAGKALAQMPMFAAVGSRVVFTGDSGGFERMLRGQCLNYSCSSTEFDLFWAPDLDSTILQHLGERGVMLDPNTQDRRDQIWKPQPVVPEGRAKIDLRTEKTREEIFEDFMKRVGASKREAWAAGLRDAALTSYIVSDAARQVTTEYYISSQDLRGIVLEGKEKWGGLESQLQQRRKELQSASSNDLFIGNPDIRSMTLDSIRAQIRESECMLESFRNL